MKKYTVNLKLSGDLSFTLTAENLKSAKEWASFTTNQLIRMIKDNRPKIESLKLDRDRGDIRVERIPVTKNKYIVTAPVKGDLDFSITDTELKMDSIKKAVVAIKKTVQKVLNKKSELHPQLNVFDFDRVELAGIKAKR